MPVLSRAQRADAAVESEPLSLLSQASLSIEEQPARFVALVQSATVEQLRPFAPRLLELLRVPTFGLERLDGVTPREVAVQAVLRVGYPFALQLEPDDVAFMREQSAATRRARRRALLGRLVPAAVAFVGLAFAVSGFVRVVTARSSENPVKAEIRSVTLQAPGHRVRSKTVEPVTGLELPLPTVDELVPDADRALLLERSIDQLVARGREVEALRVGLDCLALRGVDEGRCAMAADRALATLARRDSRDGFDRSTGPSEPEKAAQPETSTSEPAREREQMRARLEAMVIERAAPRPVAPLGVDPAAVGARGLSDQLFLFSEAPRAAAVRRETRKVMTVLRALVPAGEVWSGKSESLARDAKARLAAGEFSAALDLAERCVGSFPADLECLSVAATALPLANAARPAADRAAREAAVAESFEGYRRQMARVLAHAARERCEAQPAGTDESRPIACP